MSKVQTSLRIDAIKLRKAKEILNELGMNFTEAVNIFTSMIVVQQGLPFKVNLPNKEITLNELKTEFDEKTQ